MEETTLAVGLSAAYWPNLELSLRTVPDRVPKLISWYGPGEPPFLPPNSQLLRPQQHDQFYRRGYVLNVAIRQCQTPFILLADADFLYPHLFWQHLVGSRGWALRCYCALLNAHYTRLVREGLDWERLFADHQGAPPNVFDTLYGSHNPVLHHVDDLRDVHGYDERMYGWGGEDMDLAQRMRRIGLQDRRLPILFAHLSDAGILSESPTYRRGNWEGQNHQIAHDHNVPVIANPDHWGDLPA